MDKLQVVEENPNPNHTLQVQIDHPGNHDEDDTFSLSGFSMHRDTTTVDSEYSLTEDHDSFEFSTTENTNINYQFPPENIVFCGKHIIPSKQVLPKTTSPPTIEENVHVRKRGRAEYPSRPILEKPQSRELLSPIEEKRINNLKKGGGKKKVVLGHEKVSVLRSNSSKSKWHLHVLGTAPRIPMEMELSDIRSRQTRNSSKLFGNGTGNSNGGNQVGVSVGCSSTRSVKGFWGLIGCHDHADTVVKSSLVCIPRA